MADRRPVVVDPVPVEGTPEESKEPVHPDDAPLEPEEELVDMVCDRMLKYCVQWALYGVSPIQFK